jgi:hypothetical protein
MALKGKITKAELTALPADLQKEYKALVKDGSAQKDSAGNELYILDTPDMEHKDDITGLKNALEEERRQNTERGQKITGLESEKTTLAAQIEEFKKKNPDATKDQIEQVKQELLNQHKTELEAANKKGETYRTALDKVMRQDAARAAILAAGGNPKLLLPHVLESTKFIENADGTFKIQVVNEKGGERIGDSAGNPMTLDQFVAEMKSNEDFGRAFEASGAGGSGANNNANNGGGSNAKTITRAAFDQLSPQDKMAHTRAGGAVTD